MTDSILNRLRRLYPERGDLERLLRARQITVDGIVVDNPRTRVREGARVRIVVPRELCGTKKLGAAMQAFSIDARAAVALDLGASTGGFTRALLDAGARRVYAVDAGHGQLLGELRLDPRVVNLERTNLGELDARRVPEPITLATMDLSYLSIAAALPQLDAVGLVPRAELVALVKPMFELALPRAPVDHDSLAEAICAASSAAESCGWTIVSSLASPVRGAKGALEGFLHARRST